jgi:hypothetical protein
MPIEKCVHGYPTGPEYAKEIKRAERACNRLHKECSAIDFDCEHQDEAWKNQVAQDLSTLLGRAMYFLENSGDESDIFAARATLRIVRRVEGFEGIRRAK